MAAVIAVMADKQVAMLLVFSNRTELRVLTRRLTGVWCRLGRQVKHQAALSERNNVKNVSFSCCRRRRSGRTSGRRRLSRGSPT